MPYTICEPCLGTCDTACIDVCPTGALVERDYKWEKSDKEYEANWIKAGL